MYFLWLLFNAAAVSSCCSQAREDAFFKEISSEPSLRKGHPLTHLITSQSKIDSVSRGSAGQSRGKTLPAMSPYAAPTALVTVERSANFQTRRKRSTNRARAEHNASLDGSRASISGAMSESSAKHRDFLLSTLNEVQHQLTTPNALKAFVEGHTMRGIHGGATEESESEEEEEEELDEEEAELEAEEAEREVQERMELERLAEEQQQQLSAALLPPADEPEMNELMRTAFHVEGADPSPASSMFSFFSFSLSNAFDCLH